MSNDKEFVWNDELVIEYYNFAESRFKTNTKVLWSSELIHEFKQLKQPKKEKLFTTEDNVDIYARDIFYYVGDAWNICETQLIANEKWLNHLMHKSFSTEQAAQEYIKKHKPKYSESDMEKCFDESRKTNSLIGFKYLSYAEYIQSLNK